jgi:hypothetical protein
MRKVVHRTELTFRAGSHDASRIRTTIHSETSYRQPEHDGFDDASHRGSRAQYGGANSPRIRINDRMCLRAALPSAPDRSSDPPSSHFCKAFHFCD